MATKVFRPFSLEECGDILNVEDMARLFKVTTAAINTRCRNGTIPGAFKQDKAWYCAKENIKKLR